MDDTRNPRNNCGATAVHADYFTLPYHSQLWDPHFTHAVHRNYPAIPSLFGFQFRPGGRAISVTSLLKNPSRLSLVPVFEAGNNNDGSNKDGVAYGMTPITRHPLILPVVLWGIATALSLGWTTSGIFPLWRTRHLCHCWLLVYGAQDLRVSNEEGSVGTVFNPDDSRRTCFCETTAISSESRWAAIAFQHCKRTAMVGICSRDRCWIRTTNFCFY